MVHEVVFSVGTRAVVCTCGESFRSDRRGRFAAHQERTAVDKWAAHLKSSRLALAGGP